MRSLNVIVRAIMLALGCLPAHLALADTVKDFFQGKTLQVLCGAPAGGVFDLYARTYAKYLTRHIPGNPCVVAQNIPTSGSIQAVNRVYNDAPKDGTVIVAPSNAAPFMPLLGLDQARYDPRAMTWLGSPTGENSVFFVWHAHPVKTFEDLKKIEVIVGSNGPNASPAFIAKAMNVVFNTRIKPIYGYPSPAEAMLALQQGEIHGYTGIFWNQLKTAYGDLLRENRLRFLMQFGRSAHPDLSGVPMVTDLMTVDKDKKIFAAVTAPLAVGYPLAIGPNVPAERAAALVIATAGTFADKDFVNEAQRLHLDVAPMTSADVTKIITDAYSASPTLVERLRSLYNAQ